MFQGKEVLPVEGQVLIAQRLTHLPRVATQSYQATTKSLSLAAADALKKLLSEGKNVTNSCSMVPILLF